MSREVVSLENHSVEMHEPKYSACGAGRHENRVNDLKWYQPEFIDGCAPLDTRLGPQLSKVGDSSAVAPKEKMPCFNKTILTESRRLRLRLEFFAREARSKPPGLT